MLGAKDAALIIGVSTAHVGKLVWEGVLPKPKKHARFALEVEDVEAYALQRLAHPGRHKTVPGPHPYFADMTEAAGILGVSRSAVRQLLAKWFLPSVKAPNGRVYFRRPQLAVIARARNERYHPDRATLASSTGAAEPNGGVIGL